MGGAWSPGHAGRVQRWGGGGLVPDRDGGTDSGSGDARMGKVTREGC